MSEPRIYQMSVRAIKSGYDHAYVVLSAEDDRKAMSYDAFYGFYPTDAAEGSLPTEMYRFIVKGVPGSITREDRQALAIPPTYELIATLDSTEYHQALHMLDRWKKQTTYRLASQDCVTFASDMAKAVGMKIPARLVYGPQGYVKALIDANTGQ